MHARTHARMCAYSRTNARARALSVSLCLSPSLSLCLSVCLSVSRELSLSPPHPHPTPPPSLSLARALSLSHTHRRPVTAHARRNPQHREISPLSHYGRQSQPATVLFLFVVLRAVTPCPRAYRTAPLPSHLKLRKRRPTTSAAAPAAVINIRRRWQIS